MKIPSIVIQIGLFVLTFITTTLSGIEWITSKSVIFDSCEIKMGGNVTWDDVLEGMKFSIPFLLILTVHEFGHYLTAMYYKAKVTLPYYIPMWFFGFSASIGTMGAFIKIKSPLRTTKEFFDVGIAGPIAGFVVALGFIWYGFATLPQPEYIYNIHPDYEEAYQEHGMGSMEVYSDEYQKEQYIKNRLACNPEAKPEPPQEFEMLALGDNLLFTFFKWVYADKSDLIPNQYELFHYPFLFAGFLACFFTALNLIPIGQLDGGHVMYGLLGYKKVNKISPYIYKVFLFYAGLGLINPNQLQEDLIWYVPVYLYFLNLCFSNIHTDFKERMIWILGIFVAQFGLVYLFPTLEGYPGYLLFGLIIGKFLGVKHPPSLIEIPIGSNRKIVGWIAIVIFIICFSPHPFVM